MTNIYFFFFFFFFLLNETSNAKEFEYFLYLIGEWNEDTTVSS